MGHCVIQGAGFIVDISLDLRSGHIRREFADSRDVQVSQIKVIRTFVISATETFARN